MSKEETKRLKNKLSIYGSFRRENEELCKRLEEIEKSMRDHDDWPDAAAFELGIKSIDNKHPYVQQMIIEKTTIEAKLKFNEIEIGYLGINELLDELGDEEYDLIKMAYIENQSYENIGRWMSCDKSQVSRMIDKILESCNTLH